MLNNCNHTIHKERSHYGWNNAFPPQLTIGPGDTIEFETVDASGTQIGPNSTVDDVAALDFTKVDPVTGPVFIDGAEPGDAIKVTLLELEPSGWGWTALIPGFGLLADQFPDPELRLWKYEPRSKGPLLYGPAAKVPLKAMCGNIGLAPEAPGLHSTVPPRRTGGNMDTRDVSEGTELYLPVEVPGALFSVGDTHAAQGDGELCGTAIESPMKVAAKFELIKDADLAFPRFTTPGPVSRHLDEKGYEVTTGIGPDLYDGARAAVSGMINLLCSRYSMSPADAYMLISITSDLRITEIVDRPNFVVALYFPRLVLE